MILIRRCAKGLLALLLLLTAGCSILDPGGDQGGEPAGPSANTPAPPETPLPGGPVAQILQVLPGDLTAVRVDYLAGMLADDELKTLARKRHLDYWGDRLEALGIFLGDVDYIAGPLRAESGNLLVLTGNLDLEGLRNELYDLGFKEEEYRENELWLGKWPEEGGPSAGSVAVGFLSNGMVALGWPGAEGTKQVKHVIRVMVRGRGSLFQDPMFQQIAAALPEGLMTRVEVGCGEWELRGCQAWGEVVAAEDGAAVRRHWVLVFRNERAAGFGIDNVEELLGETDVYELKVSQEGLTLVAEGFQDTRDLVLRLQTQAPWRPLPPTVPPPTTVPPIEVVTIVPTAPTTTPIPTAQPRPAARTPVAAGRKLERLIIALPPTGWDTNFTYRTSTTGTLDKRPVQEHLIGVNRVTGAYEPQLAVRWEVSPNGKDWTFTLRKGVQWHPEPQKPEGWGEFTARDVRHTAYMHTAPQSLASNGSVWRDITGVTRADQTAVNGKELVARKVSEAVEIIDDYTVVIHSQTVQPELYYYHSINRGYPIVSKARWDALGDVDIGRSVVGTGPFKFIERREAQNIRYEAVQDHWRVTPSYNELEWRWVAENATSVAMLLTGEAHMADIERALQGPAEDRGMRVVRSKFPGMHVHWGYYGLYQTVPEYLDPDLPWLDVRVRRAMQKSIDSRASVKALMPGTQVEYPSIYGFHPVLDEDMWPGIWNPRWFQDWEEYYGYDPAKAKELLSQAGYPQAFEFTIHLYRLAGVPEMVDFGQAMAMYFERIGLRPKLVEIDYPVSRAMARKHQASGILRPSRSSHRSILSVGSYSTKLSSTHVYTDPQMDLVIDELEQTVENRRRAKLLQIIGDIQFYDNARIQLFGLYVDMTVNPQFVASYDFPATVSGYFTHLEYVETVPRR